MKGAEATAVAIFLARSGKSMIEIRDYIEEHYYDIKFKLADIRATYSFDVSCQGSVPQAMETFFESTGFEDTIRKSSQRHTATSSNTIELIRKRFISRKA